MTIFLFSNLSTNTETKALTFDELPIKQTSKNWSVKIEEDLLGEKGPTKPKTGEYNAYSLKVESVGDDLHTVKINMYRDEPNSTVKYSLYWCPDDNDCNKINHNRAISLANQMKKGKPYTYHFPLAEKASELEIEVIWTKEKNGRPMKETFIFNNM